MTVASAAGRPQCIENQTGKSCDDNNGTKTKKKLVIKKQTYVGWHVAVHKLHNNIYKIIVTHTLFTLI